MSEQVGEVHVDVHADTSGLAGEVDRGVQRAARQAGDIEVGMDLDPGAARRLRAEAARAARAAEQTVHFEADADFMSIVGEARRAARLARQRVEFEAHLNTRGFYFDAFSGNFRRLIDNSVVGIDDLAAALDGLDNQAQRTGQVFGGMAQVIENSAVAFAARAMTQMAAFGLLIGAVIPYVVALVAALGSLIAVAIQAAGSLVSVAAAVAAIGIGYATAIVGTQGLTDAFSAQAKALQELEETGKVTEATQKKLDAAMKRLSPSAREFVTEVIGLRDEWRKMQQTVQENLFADLGDSLRRTAVEVLPVLESGLGRIATLLNAAALGFLNWARSADGVATLTGILGTAERLLDNILRILGNVGQGLANLFIGAGPGAERFLAWIEEITQRFEDWTERISKDGSLDKFLSDSLTALQAIARLAGSMVGLIAAAIGPGQAGERGLDLIDKIATKFEELTAWLNDPANQGAIDEFWSDVETNLATLADLLESVDWKQLASDLQGLATAIGLLAKALTGLHDIGAFSNVFSLFDQLQTMWANRDMIDWDATLLSWFAGFSGAVEGALAFFAPQIIAAFQSFFEGVASGQIDWAYVIYTLLFPLPAFIASTLMTFQPQAVQAFTDFFAGLGLDWVYIAYTILFPLPAAIVNTLLTFGPQISAGMTALFTTNTIIDWGAVAANLLAPFPLAVYNLLVSFGPMITAGMTMMFSSTPTVITGVINMIVGPFSGLAVTIVARMGNWLSALTGWFAGSAGIAIATALNIISPFGGLATRIIANAGSIYAAVSGWFAGLGSLAAAAAEALIAPFRGLASSIVAAMGVISLPVAVANIAGAAQGIQVTNGPQLRMIGEAGPEAIIPLSRTQILDPAVSTFLKGVAADRWGTPKPKDGGLPITPQINVQMPTDDPEAAAMAVWNRLVFEGVV